MFLSRGLMGSCTQCIPIHASGIVPFSRTIFRRLNVCVGMFVSGEAVSIAAWHCTTTSPTTAIHAYLMPSDLWASLIFGQENWRPACINRRGQGHVLT
jgi:hypothetical protein